MNRFKPDWVSPPGDTISDLMVERGVSRARFAVMVGLTLVEVGGLLRGEAEITQRLAKALERVFGVSAAFWMARENHYRESKRFGKI